MSNFTSACIWEWATRNEWSETVHLETRTKRNNKGEEVKRIACVQWGREEQNEQAKESEVVKHSIWWYTIHREEEMKRMTMRHWVCEVERKREREKGTRRESSSLVEHHSLACRVETWAWHNVDLWSGIEVSLWKREFRETKRRRTTSVAKSFRTLWTFPPFWWISPSTITTHEIAIRIRLLLLLCAREKGES